MSQLPQGLVGVSQHVVLDGMATRHDPYGDTSALRRVSGKNYGRVFSVLNNGMLLVCSAGNPDPTFADQVSYSFGSADFAQNNIRLIDLTGHTVDTAVVVIPASPKDTQQMFLGWTAEPEYVVNVDDSTSRIVYVQTYSLSPGSVAQVLGTRRFTVTVSFTDASVSVSSVVSWGDDEPGRTSMADYSPVEGQDYAVGFTHAAGAEGADPTHPNDPYVWTVQGAQISTGAELWKQTFTLPCPGPGSRGTSCLQTMPDGSWAYGWVQTDSSDAATYGQLSSYRFVGNSSGCSVETEVRMTGAGSDWVLRSLNDYWWAGRLQVTADAGNTFGLIPFDDYNDAGGVFSNYPDSEQPKVTLLGPSGSYDAAARIGKRYNLAGTAGPLFAKQFGRLSVVLGYGQSYFIEEVADDNTGRAGRDPARTGNWGVAMAAVDWQTQEVCPGLLALPRRGVWGPWVVFPYADYNAATGTLVVLSEVQIQPTYEPNVVYWYTAIWVWSSLAAADTTNVIASNPQ